MGSLQSAWDTSGITAPVIVRSKRQRYGETEQVCLRQLMCIPSVSENVARVLLEQFGTLPKLCQALEDPNTFPKRIRLDERSCLGQARIQLLTKYLAHK